MRISEASTACGLSPDTIRYYEKSGMIPAVGRTQNGHRHFTPEIIDWLTLLYWLRKTGMPMEKMKRFTELAQQGDNTIETRRKILADHSRELRSRRDELDRCEQVLAGKIGSYDKLLSERTS